MAGDATRSRLRRVWMALRTMMWKNMLLKRRRWRATLAEIVMPLVVFAVAVWWVHT